MKISFDLIAPMVIQMEVVVKMGLALGFAFVLASCGSENDDIPGTYSFESRFDVEASSVSYTGQVKRHLLISDMKSYLSGLTTPIDANELEPAPGEIAEGLLFYYDFDGSGEESTVLLTAALPVLQNTYGAITAGKNLSGKIAGNDNGGAKDFKNWNGGDFVGWNDGAPGSPDSLVRLFISRVDALAVNRAQENPELDPSGAAIENVYVDSQGRDYQQLLQKFLLGAVAYAQATDDYLDEGLSEEHASPVEGKPYSALEHAFDEAFGYFGASRDFADYSDDEIAKSGGRSDYQGAHDTNGDGQIDLTAEYIFGHAQNAGKRDRGASTDYTADLINAFIQGRSVLAQTNSALTAEEMAELTSARDIISSSWERVIAATVIHYFNEVLVDLSSHTTGNYSFLNHAKHWSELKGFSLSLQFNPRKLISDEDFQTLQTNIGDQPTLETDEGTIAARKSVLVQMRALLGDKYGFTAGELGDENGEGGL